MLIVQPAWWVAREMAVEGVDKEREWQVALELGGAPGEHQVAAFLGAGRELREQARLADSRLSAQPDDAAGPRSTAASARSSTPSSCRRPTRAGCTVDTTGG